MTWLNCGLRRTHWVEEVSHPLGDDEGEHDGDAERDVARALDDDHREADGHAHRAAELTRRAHDHVPRDVRALHQQQEL